MKYFLCLIFIVHFLNNFTFSSTYEDIIVWQENRPLEWKDFEGLSPKEPGLKLAVSNIQIAIIGKYYKNVIPEVRVEAQFTKSKSWSITSDNRSLSHEQIHFDIAELYARKIRKKFDSLRSKKISDSNVYNEVYYNLVFQHGRLQRQFDGEAYSSVEKENKWKEKVVRKLESLKDYKLIKDSE
ncbi:MAG: hypothetical protein AAGA43_14010 [Bacteroidota bacterium]